MKIEVSVEGVVPDKSAEQQILLLKPKNNDGSQYLPIWIGSTEADSIRSALKRGLPEERPLSHDLLRSILTGFKVTIQKIVIHKMVQGTFFSHIYLSKNGTELVIDSRPSDAVSLAIRMNAPIFIDEAVYIQQNVNLNP